MSFHSEIEDEAKEIIDFGEIAYWPIGKAIAIGFGKTQFQRKMKFVSQISAMFGERQVMI